MHTSYLNFLKNWNGMWNINAKQYILYKASKVIQKVIFVEKIHCGFSMICIFVPNSIVSHAAALIEEEKKRPLIHKRRRLARLIELKSS